MFFSGSVVVSAVVGFAAAQSAYSISMAVSETLLPSATSSAPVVLQTDSGAPGGAAEGMVATHIVQVGGPNGSLTFLPNNVKAAPGDLVQFHFHPKNHSVVQSTFDNPCVPIQNMLPNKTDAFFSGYMPTNASFAATNQVLTYTIRVQDEKPVWFYCSQGMHCQAGMVGAINAPTSGNKTMAAFTALAATAPENLTPGSTSGSSSSSGSGSGSSGSGSSSGSSGNTPTPPPPGAGANGTASSFPAQATANVASSLSRQSLLGLGAATFAAFAML